MTGSSSRRSLRIRAWSRAAVISADPDSLACVRGSNADDQMSCCAGAGVRSDPDVYVSGCCAVVERDQGVGRVRIVGQPGAKPFRVGLALAGFEEHVLRLLVQGEL
ncbi:hypothetical protein [Streptomyces sp. NPDC055400]